MARAFEPLSAVRSGRFTRPPAWDPRGEALDLAVAVRRRGEGDCAGAGGHITDESVGERGQELPPRIGALGCTWDMNGGAGGEARSPGVQRPRPVTARAIDMFAKNCALRILKFGRRTAER